MTKLEKIGVLSLAKFEAVVGATIGLIFGICFALMGALLSTITGFKGIGIGFDIFSIIVMPVMYAVIGFIAGAIIALIYNLVAKWVGGVEVVLKN